DRISEFRYSHTAKHSRVVRQSVRQILRYSKANDQPVNVNSTANPHRDFIGICIIAAVCNEAEGGRVRLTIVEVDCRFRLGRKATHLEGIVQVVDEEFYSRYTRRPT